MTSRFVRNQSRPSHVVDRLREREARSDARYEATPTTFTLWTPRGNHEGVIRVYTKL